MEFESEKIGRTIVDMCGDTPLGRDLMEQLVKSDLFLTDLKKKHPEFAEFITGCGHYDEFLRELAIQKVVYANFNLPGDLASCIVWSETEDPALWLKLNGDFYKGLWKVETKKYHFYDTKVNLDTLCMDTLEEGGVAFIATSEKGIVYGVLRTARVDFSTDGKRIEHDGRTPFDCYFADGYQEEEVKSQLKGFSNEYREDAANLKARIFDRDRDKTGGFRVNVITM
ncbi:MAG: hypothetical protein GY799_21020 [Desulfobulbaceae bacterium]|nr:hypothetical protein [Desulfobulbaceae bacterium]